MESVLQLSPPIIYELLIITDYTTWISIFCSTILVRCISVWLVRFRLTLSQATDLEFSLSKSTFLSLFLEVFFIPISGNMQIYVFSVCAEKTIKKTVNSHINCYTQNSNYFERISDKCGRGKKWNLLCVPILQKAFEQDITSKMLKREQ